MAARVPCAEGNPARDNQGRVSAGHVASAREALAGMEQGGWK